MAPTVFHTRGALCGALLAALLVCGGCQEYGPRPQAATPDSLRAQRPTQISFDVRFALSTDGTRRALFVADRMERYETPDSTYLRLTGTTDTARVRTQIYDAEGDSSATITADRVIYHPDDKRFDAFGSVAVVTRDGKRLTTEMLTWRQVDRTIRTKRFVRIVTSTERVQGNGLVADEALDTYRIGKFTAEVEVDDEDDDS